MQGVRLSYMFGEFLAVVMFLKSAWIKIFWVPPPEAKVLQMRGDGLGQ